MLQEDMTEEEITQAIMREKAPALYKLVKDFVKELDVYGDDVPKELNVLKARAENLLMFIEGD